VSAMADLDAALKNLTPKQRDLLLRRLEKEKPGGGPEPDRIHRQPRAVDGGGELPLSFAQQRLWFLDRLEPGSPLYNIPAAIEIAGRLDGAALLRSLREIVRRHEALRTTFAARPEGPVQVIHPERKIEFPVADLRGLPANEREAAARRLATEEARRPFDLVRGPLLRALLIRLEEERHLAVLTVHHIVSDGWSMGVLVREIAALYPAFITGSAPALPELPVQYADFALWQRDRLQGEVLERELAFWRQRLAGAPMALDLPTDHPRPALQTFRGAQAPFRLGPEALAALRAAGKGAGQTLFMQILCAWDLLLQRWTGQDVLLVGSPIAGRARPEVQGLIGLFVNTLVLRGDLTGDPTLGELLTRVRETALAAFTHQDLPFGRLVEELHPQRDFARPPLFQVLFILQPAEADALELPGLRLAPRDLDTGTAKFELTLQLAEGEDQVSGWIEFNTDLFEPATAERMAGGLAVLLEALPGGSGRPASELPVLSAAERRQLLLEWNETGRPWPAAALLHELFERQAARTPGAPAVSFGGESLSYRDLDERANRLARVLRRRGVGPEVRVGLCVERSAGMVAALLGILKAGGAYVPLDPGHPAERLALILEDSAVAVLVTEERLLAGLPSHDAEVLCLDGEIGSEDAGPLEPLAVEENLAYVIYTSGSTGRPKGVQLPHRAVVNFLHAMTERPGLGPDDVVPALTTLTFDIAGLEIYLPLAVGGRVEVLERDEAADGRRLAARLAAVGATAVQATPATWRLLVTTGWRGMPGLKILCGGEALPRDLAGELLARGAELWNVYGPTETAVYSTTGRVAPGDGPVLLGRAIANTGLYVADPRSRLAPLGAAGELLIGGAGLARSYLGRPELTAERFVPHPWSPEPGARLYRTGDLVRWRPSGELQFLGRIDHQVKVRGFRIELGEIEAALLRHPAVAQAVVAVGSRQETVGESRLVAYVVPAGKVPAAIPSIDELREHLRRSLPEYMLPSAFVVLEALPLNPSGKVDRKALHAPEATREAASAAAWADPRNELERMIAALWREVLGIDRVGAGDNFFDLGGHSLLAAQVHVRLSEKLGRELALLDLFRYPTVASLAAFLGGGEAAAPRTGLARAAARRGAAGVGGGIAIIGMAGRFPGAGSVEAFWSNLTAGVESISFFSDEELRAAGVPEAALTDPRYVRARGVVAGADELDAPFFGYSPREAEVLDPQQRLFLECAWEAFEDAGHEPASFPGDVGVFAGAGMNTYMLNFLGDPEVLDSVGNFQLMIGNDKDFLAPRVSYKLGLTGPSLAVQSSCSTSLVAVHLACQSLLAGQCDAALAGGVSLRLPQTMGYHHHEGAVFSPDGHCRAFDAAAGGFVGGNGAAVVLLRRLEDAVRDGDPIRAVIRGSAVNNDGSLKAGFTAPSIDGQAQVIAEALSMAGIEPASIGYVEAHGTGTELGDPIEIAALALAFGPEAPRGSVLVGSLKTNIGHLDTAAGVTGLIKAALVLERGQIPPTLHFQSPNPKLRLEETPFRVADRLTDWAPGAGPRRAGVSSLGIGGTNAHAILEEAPAVVPGTPGGLWQLLPLSARSDAALDLAISRLADHLRSHPGLDPADVAWTLQTGRRRFEQRAVALCRDTDDAVAVLGGGDRERLLLGDGEARSVAFLFSGQGSQHPGMAAELYRAEAVFRAELDRACDLLLPLLGRDLRPLLFGSAAEELERTEITQPALFAVEHALARQWMAWGIRPSAMLGHSIGEYVAACLAGVFSLEDALALVAERGRLMGAMAPGAMLAVSLPEAEVLPLLGADLSLAAVNAPGRTVVSGPAEAVEALAGALEERGVRHRRLHTSHAFHSAMMEPALEPFTQALKRVRPRAPSIPFLSNVTGTWITAEQAADPLYWAGHLRGTVRFAEGIAELLREPGRVFLEVGPGNSLTTLAREMGAPAALASLPHPSDRRSDHAFALTALGRLWTAGVEVDWRAFHSGERRLRVSLPTYPFERRRYWVGGTGPLGIGGGGARRPDLSKRPDPADWLYAPTWKRADRASSVQLSPDPRHWLILAGEGVVGEGLAGLLRAGGQDVTTARAGSREELSALLGGLRSEGRAPETIVHLPALDGVDGFEEAQARGFRSLVALAQAIGDSGLSEPLDLVVVASGLFDVTGQERLAPEKATLLGPARVIPWEYPQVSCRVLDTVLEPGGEEALAQALHGELEERGERLVALRGRHRWVPDWEPVRLDGDGVRPPRVREDGVYVVTGGLGGVGSTLAGALAKGRRVRLTLLGRTPVPPREEWPARSAGNDPVAVKIRRLLALEKLGGEVLPLVADVTDRASLESALGEVRRRFGAIHGVIHAAGLPGGGLIQRRTAGESDPGLAARAGGLRLLADLLRDDPLDFLVLTSSVGSLFGEPGQTDLHAACAFFDAWAQARPRGTTVLSIDWDTWSDVGMVADIQGLPEDLRRAREQMLATGITAEEGREVLTRILERAGLPQVVVSTRDLEAVARHLRDLVNGEAAGAAPARAVYVRPELRSAYEAPSGETEEAIAAIWQELLGIERVGAHDNFFDLGGHSLLATQVMSRVRETLRADLPLEALFEAPTVSGLAGRVAGRAEPSEADALEALLREIEGLSPDEAEAAYAQESNEHF
jgi:amino acid adenylation domain-containing protein